MSRNLIERYIWILDTIGRYGRISRRELDERWRESDFGRGSHGLPRRTFYNYREGIEEIFGVKVEYNPKTFEYYLDDSNADMSGWVLNSVAVSNALQGARDVAGRIMLEEVPSAREFLAPVIQGLRANRCLRFDYQPHTRSTPSPGVEVEPYFLRIFRQLWYLTGLNRADGKVKTYALDRMASLQVLSDEFTPPPDLDPKGYFRDSFGIMVDQAEPVAVTLRAYPARAKYLRALPLHASQSEEVHDRYSLFHLRLRLTSDFIEQLLSFGPSVQVVAPAELRRQVVNSLRSSLAAYSS